MKTRLNKPVLIMCVVVLVLAVLMAAAVWLMSTHVLVKGAFYPKDALQLDLRGKKLSLQTVDAIQARLPGCRILWDIPFQGGTVPSDAEEVTVTSLTGEDRAALDHMTGSVTVHGEDCADSAELAALQESHPDWTVLYSVVIDGRAYDRNAETVKPKHLTEEDAEKLSSLLRLKTVDGSECRDYAVLSALRQSCPQWEVRYSVKMGESTVSPDASGAKVTGADYQELRDGLAGLPQLNKLTVTDPKASAEELFRLREEFPGVEIHWQLELNGEMWTESGTTQLDISGMDLETLEDAGKLAAYFPDIEKLIMSDCTVNGSAVDNEDMARFREEMRDSFLVVWTVYCGKVSARTDDTWFMPIQQGEYYFKEEHAYNLRYCEDMVCIDVGHSRISTVEFAAYMPHLKYLILTDTAVQSIEPLANCKELIYLELVFGVVRDYTPLLECTALEDLNLEKPYYTPDPSPILKMTWLKNLFWSGCSSKTRRRAEEALTQTHLDFVGRSSASGMGWRNLKNYYDMRDYLGMPYMA